MNTIRPALVIFGFLTLLTGVAYPLAITAIAQVALPHQANGSLVKDGDTIVGSELIGQNLDDAKYFWGRPSSTSPGYNGGGSSGSNAGPTNPDFLKTMGERVEALKKAHPDQKGDVPADLVYASGSGLDPHISPKAALYQVNRVADARRMTEANVRKAVEQATESPTFGMLGEARVNVLRLNRKLEAMK